MCDVRREVTVPEVVVGVAPYISTAFVRDSWWHLRQTHTILSVES